MAVEGAHVIAGAEFIGLAGLPHEVDEVALEGGRGTYGGGDAVHQQVGDDAGEQRAGAERDHVGFGDGGERGRQRADLARAQADRLDAMPAAADVGFADQDGAVGERGFERHVGGGAGVDAAGDFENFRGGLHGVRKIAQNLGEGHEEEVAEAVALEPAAGLEAVLEEAREQRGVFAERDHAVADVAGRQHVELAAQASGTAAVVGHGDDGGDVQRGRGGAGGPGVVLQALQDAGQAGTAADGDYAEWRLIFHAKGLGGRVSGHYLPFFSG